MRLQWSYTIYWPVASLFRSGFLRPQKVVGYVPGRRTAGGNERRNPYKMRARMILSCSRFSPLELVGGQVNVNRGQSALGAKACPMAMRIEYLCYLCSFYLKHLYKCIIGI